VYKEEGHQGLLMVQEAQLHSIDSTYFNSEGALFLFTNNFYCLFIEMAKLVQY